MLHNLREAVLTCDIYAPAIKSSLPRCPSVYSVVPLPCRLCLL